MAGRVLRWVNLFTFNMSELTDIDGTSVVAVDAAAGVECLIGGRAFGWALGTLRDNLRRSVDCWLDSTAQNASTHLQLYKRNSKASATVSWRKIISESKASQFNITVNCYTLWFQSLAT